MNDEETLSDIIGRINERRLSGNPPRKRTVPPPHRDTFGSSFVSFWKKGRKGRATRTEYIQSTLTWCTLVGILWFMVTPAEGRPPLDDTLSVTAAILLMVMSAALIFPNLWLTVRRLHDIGLSGWVLLLWGPAAYLVSLILFQVEITSQPLDFFYWGGCLLLATIPGEPNTNRYGPALRRITPAAPRAADRAQTEED